MGKKKLRVPLSAVDSAWLDMDESTNPMIINCVMLLSERMEYEQLLGLLKKRLIQRHSRFSQRVVDGTPGLGRMHWETDTHFDIRSHVHHLSLPEPGDQKALQRLISMLMSEPLDRIRPLWRMYLIDNVEGGCALYGRLHHVIGDVGPLLAHLVGQFGLDAVLGQEVARAAGGLELEAEIRELAGHIDHRLLVLVGDGQ